jgi:hypothetical protein
MVEEKDLSFALGRAYIGEVVGRVGLPSRRAVVDLSG